jgi:hypothetical protein
MEITRFIGIVILKVIIIYLFILLIAVTILMLTDDVPVDGKIVNLKDYLDEETGEGKMEETGEGKMEETGEGKMEETGEGKMEEKAKQKIKGKIVNLKDYLDEEKMEKKGQLKIDQKITEKNSNLNIIKNKNENINTTKFSFLDTGDIVGIGYSNIFGYFITTFTSSSWSHTGIVWKSPDNKLYVLEGASYNEPYDGIFKIPLGKWLYINRHSKLCYLKYVGTHKISPELMDQKFNQIIANHKLATINLSSIKFFNKIKYSEDFQTDLTCTEITIKLLQDINIVKKIYQSSSYFPGNIINRNLEMCDGCKYEDPKLMVIKK